MVSLVGELKIQKIFSVVLFGTNVMRACGFLRRLYIFEGIAKWLEKKKEKKRKLDLDFQRQRRSMTRSKIYNRAFCEIVNELKGVNYFRKNAPS